MNNDKRLMTWGSFYHTLNIEAERIRELMKSISDRSAKSSQRPESVDDRQTDRR